MSGEIIFQEKIFKITLEKRKQYTQVILSLVSKIKWYGCQTEKKERKNGRDNNKIFL